MQKKKLDWEPVVHGEVGLKSLLSAKPQTPAPLQMRRRGMDGKWVYREPTQEEITEYLESEAW